jgi:hypothetical protein
MANEASLVNSFYIKFTSSYSSRIPVRTLQDTFTVKTDDAIEQFTKAFIELKTRLRDRMDVDSWKIASTMKDGILQLVTQTDRLGKFGELSIIATLPCQSYS